MKPFASVLIVLSFLTMAAPLVFADHWPCGCLPVFSQYDCGDNFGGSPLYAIAPCNPDDDHLELCDPLPQPPIVCEDSSCYYCDGHGDLPNAYCVATGRY